MKGTTLSRLLVLAGATFLALSLASSADAAIIAFQGDLAGFNAMAGNPPIAVDFDSIAPGTDIAGSTLAGVTFSSPNGNTLDVVEAASTFTPGGFSGVIDPTTNVLPATTGANVLSPGGPELVPGPDPRQQDSLQLTFATPVSAFGIDLLYQSFDFASFTSFQIFDSSFSLITSGSVTTPGGGAGSPADSFFIGFVSNDPTTNIGRVVFIESDGNAANPDSNIGYDTLRFDASTRVPEPSTLSLSLLALIAVLRNRRRR